MLKPLEHSFCLPSSAVHLKCFLGVAVRDKDLQLRLPVLVFNLRTRQVAGLSVDIVDTIKMLSFAQSHIVEQAERSGLLAVPHDLEVLPYYDVIVDAHGIEVFQPLASDELPVGHKMSYGIVASDAQEAVAKFYPLLGVRIAPLVHHLEDDRECHSFVNDAQMRMFMLV